MDTGRSPSSLNQWGTAHEPPSPSPALAAAVVDSSPALAAQESHVPHRLGSGTNPAYSQPQLCFNLADARKFKADICRRAPWWTSKQVRKAANKATKYFRHMFTLKDGTPLVNCLDFSHVEECKICNFVYFGKGQSGEFRHDNIDTFCWKRFVACGLTDEQLLEFLVSPITSVKFKPGSTPEAITQHHGSTARNATQWSWIFERRDGAWFSLEAGNDGKPMKPKLAAIADHSKRHTIVGDASAPAGRPLNVDCLFGGLCDENLRNGLAEEIWGMIEFRPHGWCDNNSDAHAMEEWLMAQNVRLYATNVRAPLQLPLTQPPALAADPRSNDEIAAPAESVAPVPNAPVGSVAASMGDGRALRRIRVVAPQEEPLPTGDRSHVPWTGTPALQPAPTRPSRWESGWDQSGHWWSGGHWN